MAAIPDAIETLHPHTPHEPTARSTHQPIGPGLARSIWPPCDSLLPAVGSRNQPAKHEWEAQESPLTHSIRETCDNYKQILSSSTGFCNTWSRLSEEKGLL